MHKLPKDFVYTLGRISIVGIRPFLLFITANYIDKACSIALGVCFLTCALSFILISMDFHRGYYEAYFRKNRYRVVESFKNYIINCFVLTFFVTIVAFLFNWYYLKNSFWLSISICFYLISEKVIDELQRFYLFEKNFYKWGKMNLSRTILCSFFLVVIWLLDKFQFSPIVIFCFVVSNISVFVKPLIKIFSSFKLIVLRTNNLLIQKAILSLRSNIVVWIYVLASASILYVDRIFALFRIKSNLPAITIAATCFSIIQMGVDFFYVSRKRRDFLENKLSLKDTILSKNFIILFFITLLVSITCYSFVYKLSKSDNRLDFKVIVSLIVMQSTFAVSAIPQQILYWKNNFFRMIQIDVFTWICIVIFTMLVSTYSTEYTNIYIVFAFFFLLRLVLNVKAVNRV